MTTLPDTLAIAEQWNDKPEFKRVFLEMIAEQRRKRLAGELMPARPMSEGRNDWQNHKLGGDWSR